MAPVAAGAAVAAALLLAVPAAASSSRPGTAIAASRAVAASSAASPLALNAAMRGWVEVTLAALTPEASALERLRAVHRRLTREDLPQLAESFVRTPTAAEAFAERRADCVGFALLLVALARAAGVEARFALAPVFENSDLEGSLRIQRAHLAALFDGRLFDFGGERAFDPGREREIGDRTALALYFSNRGAQGLAAGRVAEAIEWLYRAVRYDPALSWVWTNLGVALRRSGDAAGAILAYEMALRLDALDESARRNLALARAAHD